MMEGKLKWFLKVIVYSSTVTWITTWEDGYRTKSHPFLFVGQKRMYGKWYLFIYSYIWGKALGCGSGWAGTYQAEGPSIEMQSVAAIQDLPVWKSNKATGKKKKTPCIFVRHQMHSDVLELGEIQKLSYIFHSQSPWWSSSAFKSEGKCW